MLPVVLTVLAAGVSLQVPSPQNGPQDPNVASASEASASGPKAAAPSVNVEQLRLRIREMRKNVLLGGEKVQQAQNEAADFYKRKIADIDQQLDSTQVELSEKRARYQLALDRTLEGAGAKARTTAIREAAGLRAQIASLETDKNNFEHQRKQLSQMIRAVEAHGRERERVAAKLEAVGEPSEMIALPLPPVGLAPAVPEEEAEIGLDEELIVDLMSRDERKARQVLFEADPTRYWQMFKLQPPTRPLSQALSFPAPDLPAHR